MSGTATVAITVSTTGIGDSITRTNTKLMTAPVELQTGYTVVATATATAIQLFDLVDHIALAKIYGVYLKAEVGTILITVDTAGTDTLTASTADLVLNEGEACYLPINPAGNLGLVIDALSVTDAFSWLILGKA